MFSCDTKTSNVALSDLNTDHEMELVNLMLSWDIFQAQTNGGMKAHVELCSYRRP